MKNIHVLPTDKPSRLYYHTDLKQFVLTNKTMLREFVINHNIYITSDEEIKDGIWVIENTTSPRHPYIGKTFYPKNDGTVTQEILEKELLSVKYIGHYETLAEKHDCKKIIMTTDQDLIKDGVQAIDDEFLEWFVKNPGCEEVEIESWKIDKEWNDLCKHFNPIYPKKTKYKIIIPKEEPKQETLEEVANRLFEEKGFNTLNHYDTRPSFIEGAKWQAKRMYSEEDMHKLMDEYQDYLVKTDEAVKTFKKWFEQFKKK